MKIDAVSLSWAGDKYLGRSYKEMDCQAFIERCMADVGYRRDLAGSNAWYRAMTWTGTPEECKRVFGEIPKGAFLFILEQNGREPEKYRKDGIGNASHIGMKTGRNDGAIHSSSSRGKVATSVFKDKTIKNGGWNRVGLLDVFDYGKSVNWVLEHIGIGQEPAADPDPAEDDQTAHRTRKRVDLDIGKIMALHRAKWSNKQIAEEMGVSVATIQRYVAANRECDSV